MSGSGGRLVREEVETPLGRMVLIGRDEGLCAAAFGARFPRQRAHLRRRFGGGLEIVSGRLAATREIRSYFRGDVEALARIVVDPGGTAFQERVWRRLRGIGPGRTLTYREVARALGAPQACRAVGAANGANPVALVIPCHRLVGSGGSLTGYEFGLARKRWLLDHEARHAP